jgi:hypothetical protein
MKDSVNNSLFSVERKKNSDNKKWVEREQNQVNDSKEEWNEEKSGPIIGEKKIHEEPGYSFPSHYSFHSQNKEYFYLNDQQLFSQLPDENATYNVYLAIYKMHAKKPALQFIFQNEKGTGTGTGTGTLPQEYTLPQIKLSPHENLQNIAYVAAMDITKAHHKPSFSPKYKGFVYLHEEENTESETEKNIVVLYDFTGFQNVEAKTKAEANGSESPDYLWVTPFEIVYKRAINGTPIATDICNLFYRDKRLTHIEDESGVPVEIPYTLYLCKTKSSSENGTIENVIQASSIVEPRVNHPILGNFHLFSCDPIETGVNAKYAVFIKDDDAQFIIDRDLGQNTEQNDLYTDGEKPVYECVFFRENNVSYWSIKNPDLFVSL